MKRIIAFGLGAAMLLGSMVAIAQDAKMPAASGKAAAAASMPSMAQMDEHIKKMQALHDRMMVATAPEERQKAMEDARREMQESMTMMKPMMQSGGMIGNAMMAQKGKSADTGAQTQMLSRRMDMMQMMMQMMMDQQGMTGAPKAPESTPKK